MAKTDEDESMEQRLVQATVEERSPFCGARGSNSGLGANAAHGWVVVVVALGCGVSRDEAGGGQSASTLVGIGIASLVGQEDVAAEGRMEGSYAGAGEKPVTGVYAQAGGG